MPARRNPRRGGSGRSTPPAASSSATAQVCLVHRPRYDDWTLPKGKLDRGESFEDAALREVWEETGLRCRLGEELEPARYRDHKGRPKLVRYWAMEVEHDEGFDAERRGRRGALGHARRRRRAAHLRP